MDRYIGKSAMVLGKDRYYSLDCQKTQLNNNVLVVGASGTGKTRSIVSPNILMASGSYVISDPKGILYDKYKKYLQAQGYEVKKLDFTNPRKSCGYNFFNYIKNTQDIVKVSHMMVNSEEGVRSTADPFWDRAAQLLLQAAIAYLQEACSRRDRNLKNVLRLVSLCQIDENDSSSQTVLDAMFEELEKTNPNSYAAKTYKKFRIAAGRTLRSILITLNSTLGLMDTPEIEKMTEEDTIDIESIGKTKTAIFVVVSDTDRSLDRLVNIFFSQTMNVLCEYADKRCINNELPVPVRFILDDFATNCKIDDFPRMISSIRSRGISVMLMIQAESQLKKGYGDDDKTIISNCDTYIYLGGNDVETAKAVAERLDIPAKKVLNMPVGTNWIFRRGEEAYNGVNLQLETLNAEKRVDFGTVR